MISPLAAAASTAGGGPVGLRRCPAVRNFSKGVATYIFIVVFQDEEE